MIKEIPRLPLEGNIDLTYRCNNHCRHCWLSIPADSKEKKKELAFDEIRRIVDEARAMGCRRWNISGGEPLLRPDFPEIFDYLTHKAISYSLNTNGTLITPEIARLLKRKGTKMIALYGATADVYDYITRHPGGFEKLMRGFEYLKEAGTGFIVQLIPMRANYHQWEEMIALAQSLSKHWRCGAPWLYLSYNGSKERNKEIMEQRLSPADVINLDKPDPTYAERMAELGNCLSETADENQKEKTCGDYGKADDRLFAGCIDARRDFHIDPYGMMSWCCFIKDNALRYDLRKGSFADAWDKFIPSCKDKIRGGDEWRKKCGSCESRRDCRWCAVYAYLETGRYSAPIPHLCAVAKEARKFKNDWKKNHRRYFRIAGITVRIESDLDFRKIKFKDELMKFAVEGPGEDNVNFRHHFELPDLKGKNLGRELYRKPPWAISRNKDGTWFYLGISPRKEDDTLHRVAVFSADHRHGTIYNPPRDRDRVLKDGWHSLSHFPTDQIWLGPLLAERNAVLLHSAAAIVNGRGLVFVGHSEAGKSTMMELLKAANRRGKISAEILCDDRNVLRFWQGDAVNLLTSSLKREQTISSSLRGTQILPSPLRRSPANETVSQVGRMSFRSPADPAFAGEPAGSYSARNLKISLVALGTKISPSGRNDMKKHYKTVSNAGGEGQSLPRTRYEKDLPSPLMGEGQGGGDNGQWLVHGTWSHGTTADVSPSSAPIHSIFFLKQDKKNKIEPLTDRKKIWHQLLATLIRPMVTAEWWQKELDVLEQIVNEIPCYIMHFDKTGEIVEKIKVLSSTFNVQS
ncbi:MAG: radical SAM protein [Syntrophaceae bacterium]|nr:radical SAM protein [Syntrophaceae bacterium]